MVSREEFIKTALPYASITHASFARELAFSFDTRTMQAGDIFIALEGKKVNGHDFIKDAIEKGAAGIIIAQNKKECLESIAKSKLKNIAIIQVPNTYQALIDLARAWREQFTYPVIGVTGSVGKTFTKESIAAVLRGAGVSYLASYGNHNTVYGLALSIFQMRAHHQVAVFELGISRRGEMALLASIAKPTLAVITNVGHCHMEGLGSLVDIANEKREIFKFFKEDNIGIINGDQPLLASVAYTHPVIKFGLKTTNQIQARKVRMTDAGVSCTLKWYGKKYQMTIRKNHSGAVFNALATIAVAHLLQIDPEIVLATIQEPPVIKGRFNELLLKNGSGTLIDDCYNANPESMKAALLAFQKVETSATKIAVLGDMLELGGNSPFWHRQIGRFLRKVPTLKKLILVGSSVKWIEKTVPPTIEVTLVPSWKEALEAVKSTMTKKSLILVKGSLGMQLQNVVHALTESGHESKTVSR